MDRVGCEGAHVPWGATASPSHAGLRADALRAEDARRFGKLEELAPIVRGLSPRTRVFVIEGGDHSFAVPKKSGATKDEVLAHVVDEVAVMTRER
jgi:predicted alpha/beta-hydrolase family hydrolase